MKRAGCSPSPITIRNVVYHWDFRVNDGMLAAERADRQLTDRQLVADMDGLARRGKLCGGLRVGVERGARIGIEEGRQPLLIHVVGVLMGDHDRGQAGDALEAVREVTRIEQHRGVAEVGENARMAEMRELHVYDCALMSCRGMRLVLATTLIAGGLLFASVVVRSSPARSRRPARRYATRFPTRPGSSAAAIPLNSVYHWPPRRPGPQSPMTGAATPRFRFEELCATPAFPQDTRDSAVAGSRRRSDNPRAVAAAGRGRALAGRHRPRWPERDVGLRHRRQRRCAAASWAPPASRRRSPSTSRTGCPR